MTGWPCALLLMACGVPAALAQDAGSRAYPRLEWFAGYSAIETNDHTFQFRDIGPVGNLDFDEKGKGFEAAVIGNVNRYLGIMGNFSAHFSQNQFSVPVSPAQGGSINPRMLYFLAGPEVKWRNRTRLTPVAHALFGIANATATFTTSGSSVSLSRTDAENGFAMAVQGGFDVRLSSRFGFRAMVGRSLAFVGSSDLASQKVNALGWSGGFLFH